MEEEEEEVMEQQMVSATAADSHCWTVTCTGAPEVITESSAWSLAWSLLRFRRRRALLRNGRGETAKSNKIAFKWLKSRSTSTAV